MKKTLLILGLCIFSIGAMAAQSVKYSDLPDSSKKIIDNTIKFYKKLETCTPAELNEQGMSIKIYGMEDGMCHWLSKTPGATVKNSKTGETLSLSYCNYRASKATAKKFAQGIIKMTKATYGMDNVTLDKFETQNIVRGVYELQTKYCK